MPSCDALGGATVGREPEFGVTSLRGFLTSPRIPVHVQLLHPQVHHRMASSTISRFIEAFNKTIKKYCLLSMIT